MSRDLIRKRSQRVSNAEIQIQQQLQKHDIHYLTQQQFCLQSTTPDLFFPNVNMAVYIDGEQVHRNRETKDTELRDKLKLRYGCTVRVYSYKAPLTKTKLAEIVTQILDDHKGLKRMKH